MYIFEFFRILWVAFKTKWAKHFDSSSSLNSIYCLPTKTTQNILFFWCVYSFWLYFFLICCPFILIWRVILNFQNFLQCFLFTLKKILNFLNFLTFLNFMNFVIFLIFFEFSDSWFFWTIYFCFCLPSKMIVKFWFF